MSRTVIITHIPDKASEVQNSPEFVTLLWKALKIADDERIGHGKNAGYGALRYVITKRSLVERVKDIIAPKPPYDEEWTIDYRELEADCLGG